MPDSLGFLNAYNTITELLSQSEISLILCFFLISFYAVLLRPLALPLPAFLGVRAGHMNTEAYRLTNTSRETFSEVARNLGGVGW